MRPYYWFSLLSLSLLVCCAHAAKKMAFPVPPPPVIAAAVDAGTPEPVFTVARFDLDAQIDGSMTKKLSDAFEAAEAGGSKAMFIVINSPGGMVDQAHAEKNLIEAAKIPVFCIVDGMAASAAFWLLQHCPTRIMIDSSVLMAHDPYDVVFGPTRLTRKFLREHLESHDRDALVWGQESVARLKIPLKVYLKKVFEKDWWIASSLAKDIGAVDRVSEDNANDTIISISEELMARSETCYMPTVLAP
jgi:ATP-dependent protease ClpP protease subunit